jgi:hypothetical protein
MTNFIHQQYINDLSLCDKIIDFHRMCPVKKQGRTYGGINTAVKKSTDCDLTLIQDLSKEYVNELQLVTNAYKKQFDQCDAGGTPWGITDGINVQYYAPSEAYFGWHCERGSGADPISSRHLAFMTYLNDVDDAGETEFLYQGIKIQPKKGLTLIWPVDWTHTHRGIASPTQDKYIVTGWYNFVQKQLNGE